MITPELLTDLIDAAIAARGEVESELRDLEARQAALTRQVDELRREEDGHRLALARLFPDFQGAPQSEPVNEMNWLITDLPLSSLPRSAAIESAVRTLTQDGGLASPEQIENYIASQGRSDTRDQIGAALAYLHRRGVVERPARAQWKYVGPS